MKKHCPDPLQRKSRCSFYSVCECQTTWAVSSFTVCLSCRESPRSSSCPSWGSPYRVTDWKRNIKNQSFQFDVGHSDGPPCSRVSTLFGQGLLVLHCSLTSLYVQSCFLLFPSKILILDKYLVLITPSHHYLPGNSVWDISEWKWCWERINDHLMIMSPSYL